MNITSDPNVNEMALTSKIHAAILESLRGEAELRKKDLEFYLLGETRKMVIHLSNQLARFEEMSK